MFKLRMLALASACVLSGLMAVAPVSAATITGGLIAGDNTMVDESRETYVDANRNGLFDAGDVIFGYIQISKFQPSGALGGDQVYGVFSQQIAASSAGTKVNFVATTVAGLRLSDLLSSDPNVGANAIAAFYDRPTTFGDLIQVVPPTAPTNMQGYLDYIHDNGTLRLVAGLDGVDDFLQSTIDADANTFFGVAVNSPNAVFADSAIGQAFTLTSNKGALSFSYNDTGFLFAPRNTLGPAGPAQGDVVISSGTTGGANGTDVLPNPKDWLSAGPGFAQCTVPNPSGGFVSVPCGFTDKNNFSVTAVIPEPGSLALAGVALLAVAGLARRKSRS